VVEVVKKLGSSFVGGLCMGAEASILGVGWYWTPRFWDEGLMWSKWNIIISHNLQVYERFV